MSGREPAASEDAGRVSGSSLCQICAFVREVKGRHGQTYLLCRNTAIPDKYPRQPVVACPGYERDPQR